MRSPTEKIVSLKDLTARRDELRGQGKSVVQCHGCFDIVHPGHIRYLQFAREQGDVLVVSISGDDVVGKGVDRPYITEQLRAENVAAFEFVDYVVIDHNTWAGPILEAVRPDVYVKGKEYETNRDSRFAKESAFVESYGGKVIFSSGDVVYSSSYLINQFRDEWQLEANRLAAFTRRHQVTRSGLEQGVRGLSGKRVLVIGDAIVDRYVSCESLGVASESPILSVTPLESASYVGAAALIARQLAALGGQAALLTSYGQSKESEIFEKRLRDSGVELLRGTRTDERAIFVKTRYLIDEKKVFKVDEGRPTPLSSRGGKELLAMVAERLPEFDAVVATDFGYGLFTGEVVDGLSQQVHEAKKPFYVDVSYRGRSNLNRFKSPRLATPTEQELRFALGDAETGLSNLAARYIQATGAQRLVLTLGKRGVVFFDGQFDASGRLPTDYLPTLATSVIDEVGAGDVLLAGCVAADVVGAGFAHGLYLGSSLAALHLARMGNEPVGLTDLLGFWRSRPELA